MIGTFCVFLGIMTYLLPHERDKPYDGENGEVNLPLQIFHVPFIILIKL